MPGLFGLFFWLDIGYLGIGRKEMVQILIGLKFLNGDGLRRDQSVQSCMEAALDKES